MSLRNIIIIITIIITITTIAERIRNVDRAILNTVLENTVRRSVNVLEIGGKNLNITLTFCIVIINVRTDSLITV